jgi:hypothetical protein
MAKFNAEVREGNGSAKDASARPTKTEGSPEETRDDRGTDIVTATATIGAIGVVVALFDVALIPGMVIGVAAAFAPRYVPRVGERLEPLFDRTVKGAVKLTKKARSAVAEAQERVDDIAAEVDAEEAVKAGEVAPA